MIAEEKKTPENKTGETKKYTLYQMRMMSGKSGAHVADICQTTYHSLRNWEKGRTIPNLINVDDLLEIYGYDHDQLDRTPFYDLLIEKAQKQAQSINEADNPNRSRRQYEIEQGSPD